MIQQDINQLEEKSIFVLREAKTKFKNVAALWSMGKDSTTMLALARKAFLGKVPFPVIHLDNGIDFPETYQFREELAKKWKLDLIVGNMKIKPDLIGSACCGSNKPETLKKIMDDYGFDALIVSIRRDEHGIRAKERFFCFPSGTITYGREIKPIENVRIGDDVYTHLGVLKPVKAISSRKYKGELLSINPRFGTPIFMTPNHVILAKSTVDAVPSKIIMVTATGFDNVSRQINLNLGIKATTKWYEASKLRVGDKIYVPKLAHKIDNGLPYIEIDKIIGDHKGLHVTANELWWNSSHISAPKNQRVIKLSNDIMRLFGYYIAEGSSDNSSNQINIALNLDEIYIAEDILKIVKLNFGANGRIRRVTDNGICIDINSKTLATLFPILFGKGAHNKKLPSFYTELSQKQLSELIKGCWIGDGHAERYSTVSVTLAHQIRLAMLKLGILTSMKQWNDGRYALTVAGLSKQRFIELFGLGVEVPYIGKYNVREINELRVPNYTSRSRTGGFWVPIEKIERIQYEGDIYDLSIQDDSSYLVNGIAVHNSPRDKNFKWNYKDQPAELWDDYSSKLDTKGHIRVHPLLDWNEIDVWNYVKKEKVPVNPLYFSRNGYRYRSLGCTHCTIPLKSKAKNVDDIINELEVTTAEERSGRSMDKEREYVMQKLRALGYM